MLTTVIATVAVRTLGLEDKEASNATSGSPATSISVSAKPATADNALKVPALKISRDIGDEDWWAAADPIDVTPEQSAQLYQMKISEPEDYSRWMREHGAVDGEYLDTEITLIGNHPDGVRLMEMRPIVNCSQPLTGTLFYAPNAGESGIVGLGIDLDDPYPTGRIIKPDGTLGDEYFKAKKYDLKLGEKVTLNIHATTQEHYCEYRLQFEFIAGDKTLKRVIDHKGQPFRVTGLLGEPGGNDEYEIEYAGGVSISDPTKKVAWQRVDSA